MAEEIQVLCGLTVPFLGTALGSAAVFFMKRSLNADLTCALCGFAAGVMTAASVWSLLLPAIEQSGAYGMMRFFPSFTGFWLGVLLLLLLDRLIPLLRRRCEKPDGRSGRTAMMVFAVTLHNIPEGMAVGVAYAGFLAGGKEISASGAFLLALGIAIQNFPEGAIISMPLHAAGQSRVKAFLGGVLSGAVEPLFGAMTLLLAALVVPAMPYLLAFAAGAMLYVVVQELLPEINRGTDSPAGVLFFAAGFTLMMALDVALG